MDVRDIIIEPVLTEKSNILREGDVKTYVFKVAKKANKIMVMYAVRTLFGVLPTQCRIINVCGKRCNNRAISKNSFRRGVGRTSSWKKALVTLKKGQHIDAFEGV